MTPRLRILAVLSGIACTVATVLAAVTPVLVPTFYEGPGAFGSQWRTTVVVNNLSDSQLSGNGVMFRTVCSIPEGCSTPQVEPGQFGSIESPQAPNGILLYPTAEQAEKVAFSAHFASFPRQAFTGGSELPIVREKDFRPELLTLPYVTFGTGGTSFVRSRLRIYTLDGQSSVSVRVELRPWFFPTTPPTFTKIVRLTPATGGTPNAPLFPAFAQVDLQLEFSGAVLQAGAWNISLVPLPIASGDVPRIWAFVTVTDNATQDVTVHRPQ